MNSCLTCALEWIQVTMWKNTRISKNFLSPVVFISTIWTPPTPHQQHLSTAKPSRGLTDAETTLSVPKLLHNVYAHCSNKVIFQLTVLLWASSSRINLLATRVTHPKHGSGATGRNIEMLLQIS